MSSLPQKILADPSRQTIGSVRLPGRIELKKLSEKHKTIVALHSQGVERRAVAEAADCTPEYVSFVVAQPLAKAYLATLQEYYDSRMQALYGKSVEAVNRGLDSEDEEVALKAARLNMEAIGKLKAAKKDEGTAEDVVADILKRATVVIGQHVQINNGG